MSDPAKSVPPHSKAEYDAYVSGEPIISFSSSKTSIQLTIFVHWMCFIHLGQHRKESLMMFNRLLSTCYDTCVEKFTSKNLSDGEKDCIRNCADRHLKTTQRVGFRYSELNFIKTNIK